MNEFDDWMVDEWMNENEYKNHLSDNECSNWMNEFVQNLSKQQKVFKKICKLNGRKWYFEITCRLKKVETIYESNFIKKQQKKQSKNYSGDLLLLLSTGQNLRRIESFGWKNN